ncbi:TPA: sigma-70 family RNA polymerase sigma factor [Listeria monocytogenes]|uniref:sigma-70 family RNA polymerase sigma factor n=1 Tax=Listeria monocytogenes TaxID=1639 RepID=UPI000E6C6831|nr:sigma-70 family RNA polymerase sigma factor [Listeria monocytogenes]EHC6211604.1 sigma-70 family RNA polymerase sigma factor [Listeria monocytogenes serotype 1/2b]EAD5507048.1 sigma-70 family RNA polymerase sigma factor [Listeria monocytogenes]EAD5522054.1 sigma-70 family RNA polymerase sigma factor [Listeria monocytogenes]EAF0224255.1 sigma-70 family RNA polymerase sigma factor [Listeria monocytogenes]EAF0825135.1 sigma-70 family RNA polymerase sigma factor [Listeria monocytogenes]
MQELINEYRGALQDMQEVKANLQTKIDAEKRPPLEVGQKRVFQEMPGKNTMSKLNSILDSLQFSIDWMELGHEPAPRRAIHRRSGLQREVNVTDVETMRQWFVYEHGNAYEFEDNEPVISEWDKIRMEDAMSTMSAQEKKVFLLKHEKNLSLSQISDELEISIRSVRSYLHRGEEKIQQQIDGSLFCMAI